MDYVVLTGVLLVAFAFAASPQVPAVRRLLRAPDDDDLGPALGRARRPFSDVSDLLGDLVRSDRMVLDSRPLPLPPRPVSGTFVRVTALGRDPLAAPPDLAVLTLASDPRAAWAGALREAKGEDGLVHRATRQVVVVEVDRLGVIDLTDPAVRAHSGLSADDVVSREDTPRRRVMEAAVWARAQGILVPSRHDPDARELRVFADAVAEHVAVVRVAEEALGLDALAVTPSAREVLADEDAALAFQRALRDGRFDAWRRGLKLDRAATDDLLRVAATLSI